jgi:hypothetical protein
VAGPGAGHHLRPNRRRAFCRIVRSPKLRRSCRRSKKFSAPRQPSPVANHSLQRRNEMSTLLKNKSLLFLPIGLAVLIAIGILTS